MGKMLRIHILDISYKDYDPIELNLMRNIGASSRHKIAKIDELIENARWPPQPPSWKSILDISS